MPLPEKAETAAFVGVTSAEVKLVDDSERVAVTVIAATFVGSGAAEASVIVGTTESNVRESVFETVFGLVAASVNVEAFTTQEKTPCAEAVSVQE